jgi:hypothetical protein
VHKAHTASPHDLSLNSLLWRPQVIHAGVGPLALADINLAVAAGAHLVVFNLGSTGISPHASNRADIEAGLKLACTAGLRLLSHNIVYHLMDQIKGLAEGEGMGGIP